MKVDKDCVKCASASEDSDRHGRPDAGTMVLVVNGVIAALGGSYAGTHSVAVTVMAGCAGVSTAALIFRRKS